MRKLIAVITFLIAAALLTAALSLANKALTVIRVLPDPSNYTGQNPYTTLLLAVLFFFLACCGLVGGVGLWRGSRYSRILAGITLAGSAFCMFTPVAFNYANPIASLLISIILGLLVVYLVNDYMKSPAGSR